jgi:hypothetical protein
MRNESRGEYFQIKSNTHASHSFQRRKSIRQSPELFELLT